MRECHGMTASSVRMGGGPLAHPWMHAWTPKAVRCARSTLTHDAPAALHCWLACFVHEPTCAHARCQRSTCVFVPWAEPWWGGSQHSATQLAAYMPGSRCTAGCSSAGHCHLRACVCSVSTAAQACRPALRWRRRTAHGQAHTPSHGHSTAGQGWDFSSPPPHGSLPYLWWHVSEGQVTGRARRTAARCCQLINAQCAG